VTGLCRGADRSGLGARCVLVGLRGGGRARSHRRALRFARRSERVSYLVEQCIERCRFHQEGISTSRSSAF
jgi:hypothetical protein